MIKLGDYNKMTVVKEVDFGIYLDGGDQWQQQRHRCVRWATSPTSKCRG